MLRYEKETGKFISKDDFIAQSIGGYPNEYALGEIWENMPGEYDSEADTLKHIKRVNDLLLFACQDLLRRAMDHDLSKLKHPEKGGFDKMTPILKGLKYDPTPGSDYKKSLSELGDALSHHYANNSHHPEHYETGIDGMDLMDLIEMFFDWCAATERMKDANIHDSIEKNRDRFKISDQLVSIFHNTANRYYRKFQRNTL